MNHSEACKHWRRTHDASQPHRVHAGNGTGVVVGWRGDDGDVSAVVALDDEDSWAHDCTWLADPGELVSVTEH